MNTDYIYNEHGQVTKITTPSGEITDFGYDNINDSRATAIEMDSGKINLEITDDDSLISEVDFNNVKSTPTYNSDGLVTQLVVGDTSGDYFTTSTSYLSTGFGQYKSTTTDEFNKTTTYYHDTLTGLLEAIQNANGEDLHYIYDNEGKLIKAISLTDYNNPTANIHGIVEYEYDTKDRLIKIIMDESYYYELVYDDLNRISDIKVNTQTLMSYDYEMDDTVNTNRLSIQTYGNGDEIKFIYNDENQIVEVQFKDDDGSFVTTFKYEYDQSGNLAVFSTFLDGVLETTEYYTYDSSGKLIKVVDSENNEVKYTYDQSGNVTSLYFSMNEAEGTTNYFYNHCFAFDEYGDCIEKSNLYKYTEYTTQDDDTITKEYNHESSSLYRLDYINLIKNGTNLIVQDFIYSGDTTRLFEITYNIYNNSVEYTYRYYYDNLGNITTVKYYEDTSLKVYEHYEYDEMNQLIVEDLRDYEVSYSVLTTTNYSKYFYYDTHGNITDIKTFLYGQDDNSYTPQEHMHYSYDNTWLDQLVSYGTIDYINGVAQPLEAVQDYTYDNQGNPINITNFYYEGNYYEYADLEYDGRQLTKITVVDSSLVGKNKLDELNFNIGSYGISTITDVEVSPNTTYTLSIPNYSMDPLLYINGNDWYIEDEDASNVCSSVGEIWACTFTTSSTETSISIEIYDNSLQQFISSYGFQDYFQLEVGSSPTSIEVYSGTVATISYTYNDQGYRTSKTIVEGTTVQTISYTLVGDKVIYETDGIYEITYTYDYDGKIISFNYDEDIDDSINGIDYFYIRNQQGDITKIVDIDGTILVEYQYDAWGNIINIEDNSTNSLSSINQYTYRGYRYDKEINFYYLNSRFYNPVVGRFINADGLLGTNGNSLICSTYSYTGNNPISRIDPFGYEWELIRIYKDYYSKRYSQLIEDGVSFEEITRLLIEEFFFRSWQDPIYSYISIKSGTTILKGYSVGAGFIVGMSYSYQRVYTPDGRIADQSVSGVGGGILFGVSASSYSGVLFDITDSSKMTGYGGTISGDYSFIHADIDRYSYNDKSDSDLGLNFGLSVGAGVFAARTKTKELRIIYD